MEGQSIVRKKITFRMDNRYIGPIEVAQDIHEKLCLVLIGWNNTKKSRVSTLDTEISRCSRVAYLRNKREREKNTHELNLKLLKNQQWKLKSFSI